jgi:hypothetical protein
VVRVDESAASPAATPADESTLVAHSAGERVVTVVLRGASVVHARTGRDGASESTTAAIGRSSGDESPTIAHTGRSIELEVARAPVE